MKIVSSFIPPPQISLQSTSSHANKGNAGKTKVSGKSGYVSSEGAASTLSQKSQGNTKSIHGNDAITRSYSLGRNDVAIKRTPIIYLRAKLSEVE